MQIDSGEASRLKPPREGWGLGAPAASRDDKRFVVLVGEEKGQYPAFDISGHSVLKAVLVFDSPSSAPPSLVRVRDSRARNGDAALSPDGHHLAVLGYPDPILEIFDLP